MVADRAPARDRAQRRAPRHRRAERGLARRGQRAGARRACRRARAARPYNVLAVDSRAALERSLRYDPLARGTLLTLLAAALVALGLALVGVAARRRLRRPGRARRARRPGGAGRQARAPAARRPPAQPRRRRRRPRRRASPRPRCSALLVVDLVAVTADARATELPLRTRRSPGPCSASPCARACSRPQPSSPPPRRRDMSQPAVEHPRRLPRLPGARRRRGGPPGTDAGGAGGRDLRRARPERLGQVQLLRMLAALDQPTAGSVRVLGRDLDPARPARAAPPYRAELLGYADQHYWRALAAELEVRELVCIQLGARGRNRARAPRPCRTRCSSASGCSTAPTPIPRELSGGEQQRVAVCAALAHRPAAPARGRADRRAGRRQRTPRLRGDRRARPRRGDDDRARQPRPRVGGDRRPDRARPGRTGERGGGACRRRRRGDRRRPRRLAPPLGGAAPPHRHPLARDGAAPRGGILSSGRCRATTCAADAQKRSRRLAARRTSGETVAEARGLSRTYGEGRGGGDRAGRARRGLRRRAPDGGDRAVRLGQDDASAPPGRNSTCRRPGERPRARRGPLRPRPRRAGRASGPRRIALISQEAGLVPFLTAAENVELGLALRGIDAGGGARAARPRRLRPSGLAGATAARRVEDLSSGQRERVAVARAVAARPSLLLADEPTARLDQANALAVARLLARSRAGDRRRRRLRARTTRS